MQLLFKQLRIVNIHRDRNDREFADEVIGEHAREHARTVLFSPLHVTLL